MVILIDDGCEDDGEGACGGCEADLSRIQRADKGSLRWWYHGVAMLLTAEMVV